MPDAEFTDAPVRRRVAALQRLTPEMGEWSGPGAIAALCAGTLSPLLLTTYASGERGVAAVGCALAAALARLTVNPSAGPPAQYDHALEQKALRNATITSDTNRAVRIALCATYVWAAAVFAWRMVGAGSGGSGGSGGTASLLSRAAAGVGASTLEEMGSALGAAAQLALVWIGCFANCRVGTLWGSSGYCGQ